MHHMNTLVPSRLPVAALPAHIYTLPPLSRCGHLHAGVLEYLSERYDLGRVRHVGASAGGLAALIAACGVQPQHALERAFGISEE